MIVEVDRELVSRAVAVMADGQREEFDLLIHPKATNREAVDEPPAARTHGPEAFWASAQWLRSAYSDLVFVQDLVVREADTAVWHGTMSGRHTGDFVTFARDGSVARAFAPTGRTFTVTHTHWMRFQDNQMIEHWANRDDVGMQLQLGWVPPSPAYLLKCSRATSRARRRYA
ncbi:putative ester cyclase [Branchiibius hedensis]|uniref:Predicted ester cyclase n=1 Tax=Branchiibius hedensis TaxID=672460 RepID=A0A2Y9BTC7_9MICO|nr:ester cyclase [Branchiibius hedensis]PWJ25007.1 putative ester cyclase [Branchiibius hedensis]SSA33822.1 Predicted ester cyclase [Branchiibius hedensis]